MNKDFIFFIVEQFKKIEEDKSNELDGFVLIKFSVHQQILLQTYEQLIKIDVTPIEQLPPQEKTKYWNIAKRYFTIEAEAIKGTKAAYMLSLLTSN